MEFEWDENKRRINLRDHGLDFADAYRAFTEDAFVVPDDRKDYGEDRYILLGLMRERIVVIAFTAQDDVIRIISMRKANKRERESYVQRRFGTGKRYDE
jgi:uncharacterized DUF497 family protein